MHGLLIREIPTDNFLLFPPDKFKVNLSENFVKSNFLRIILIILSRLYSFILFKCP